MIEWILFLVLSLILIVHALTRPHRHRFYRLGVFECLLALLFLNAGYWFYKPFSALQLISWLFLCLSLWLVIHGFILLRRVGAPQEDIENTTRLVTVGLYRYIRHPLYASLLYLGIGAFCKHISLLSTVLMAVLAAFVFATARVEEQENVIKFGSSYREYMDNTKMFFPFIF